MSKSNPQECHSKWTNSSNTVSTNKECAREAKINDQLTVSVGVNECLMWSGTELSPLGYLPG